MKTKVLNFINRNELWQITTIIIVYIYFNPTVSGTILFLLFHRYLNMQRIDHSTDKALLLVKQIKNKKSLAVEQNGTIKIEYYEEKKSITRSKKNQRLKEVA